MKDYLSGIISILVDCAGPECDRVYYDSSQN